MTSGYGATVVLTGHGFGHGIGMSQVGAYGYAVHFGWTWDQILGHYYGGTTLAPTDPNQALTVRLTAGDDDPVTAVIQDAGAVTTSVTGAEQYRAAAAVEVAPGSYNVYARTDAVNCPSATTAAEFEAPGSPWVKKAAGVPSVDFAPAGVDPATAPVASLLGVCERPGTDQFDAGIHARYYRGTIRAVNGSESEDRTVNIVALDRYVQGVVPREMPAAWGADGGGAGLNALRAQAVAARSYGLLAGPLHLRQDVRYAVVPGLRRGRVPGRGERRGRRPVADRRHRVAVGQPGHDRHVRRGADGGRQRRQRPLLGLVGRLHE